MAKKPEEIKPGLPAWQGTFGDLMNLLLCFFVLLFSMATMDAAKFEEVAASFSSAFGIFNGGELALGKGALIGDGVSQLTELSSYITSMGLAQSGDDASEEEDAVGEKDEEQLKEALEEKQLEASQELAEKIAEAAEKNKPKTPEERREDMIEEATGVEESEGLLSEVLDELTDVMEEVTEEITEETVDELEEITEELDPLAIEEKELIEK